MMQMRSKRGVRTSPAVFLSFVLILAAGCYGNMYDESSIDKEATAVLRGPIGPGFPMKLTIGEQEKPKKTVRIPAGNHTFDVQWIGETDAPPDFAEGYLVRVPLRCSLTYDIKAGRKYDVTVVGGRVSLYEYEATKLTGARHNGSIVESCEGSYVGCCP
jgi:hypothetical protein